MQTLKNGKHSEDSYVDKRTPVGVDYVRSSVIIEVRKIWISNNSKKSDKCLGKSLKFLGVISNKSRFTRIVRCMFTWLEIIFVVQVQEGPI